MSDSVIVLQTKNPRFPRACFLVKDLETVERFLENAFVFKGVPWEKVTSLVQVGGHPQLYRLMEASPYTWSDFFQEEFPYTMVPFEVFPSPRGYKAERTDIERMRRIKGRLTTDSSGTPGVQWEASAGALLTSRISSMRVKMKGVLYETPCETCRKFFDHLAGQCKLLTLDGGRHTSTLCHMELFTKSDAVEEIEPAVAPADLPVEVD